MLLIHAKSKTYKRYWLLNCIYSYSHGLMAGDQLARPSGNLQADHFTHKCDARPLRLNDAIHTIKKRYYTLQTDHKREELATLSSISHGWGDVNKVEY